MAGGEYKLNDVKVLNDDGTAWDVADKKTMACYIQKMTTDGSGAYDTAKIYNYRHFYQTVPKTVDRGLGWYVGSGSSTRIDDTVTIKNGEGISIYVQGTAAIKLQFSGAVTLTARSCQLGTGYSLVGNLTPGTIKLSDIKILNADGSAWDVADKKTSACYIQKMTTDGSGAYDTSKMYNYRHFYQTVPKTVDRGLGWYVGSGSATRVDDTVTIGEGEAFSINNTSGANIILQFPKPLGE